MLARLRLDRLVRRDDEKHRIDPADAGEHVLDEPLVPRHVDEPDLHLPVAKASEPEIDRDPPLLLLREPVTIHPRQRPHQRRLPMINMPRRTNDSPFQIELLLPAENISTGTLT